MRDIVLDKDPVVSCIAEQCDPEKSMDSEVNFIADRIEG